MPTVRTNGIQTYYEEYGDGPPVVFLHGATSDHRIWAEQALPLADDYRVVVYDLRGHGRTGPTEIASYTMELFAEDFQAFITALDLDRPALCGLSMGGMIAQTYAAEHPETISAFASLGVTAPEYLTRGEWFQHRVFRVSDALSTIVGRDRIDALLHLISQWRHDEKASGDLELAERIQQSHASEFPEITEQESEKIRDVLMAYPSITIDHSSITVPSLLLYGVYEPEIAARHARYMADRIPEAEAREIPSAGHNSHVDNPEFIVESLRELLDDAFDHRRSSP